MEIQLLDCTLRDGGYVNDWNFGEANIEFIIDSLVNSGINYIECGFLKLEGKFGTSVYDGIYTGQNPLSSYLVTYPKQKFTVMYNAGEFEPEKILKEKILQNLFIRIAFRKNYVDKAVNDAYKLIDAGVNVFLNPMFTNSYSKEELDLLIKKVNVIHPYALCITDSTGSLTTKNLAELVCYFDTKLDKKIILGYHSHNNLNLAYKNVLNLINLRISRPVIADCCISGMGRGAGNLNTVEIVKKFPKQYNYKFVKNCADKIVSKIYKYSPWGPSYALFQTAKLMCHPSYGLYLESKNIKQSNYKKILSLKKKEKKYKFDKDAINKIIEAANGKY